MEDKEISEIQQDLDIDKDNLHFESIDQPKRFFKWARKMAEASKETKRAKRAIAVIRAEVSSLIRTNPSNYGLEKITDAAVQSAVEQNEEVKKVEEEYIEACYNMDIYEAAKWAMTDRKISIEGLIKLYNEGYWSRPRTDSLGQDTMNTLIDNASAEQKEKLNQIMLRRKK